MNTPEISVIVPVYNVEKYLDRCVRSIMAQTFSDLEILLIDDGSTDAGGAMCDALAEEDGRIRVIHKENGGLSDARNVGIDNAMGNCIGFIDSDDFIEADMFEFLHRNLVNDDADIAICGIFNYYDGRTPTRIASPEHKILSSTEAIRMVLDSRVISVNAVNKLYRKEIFSAGLRFRKGKIAEDAFLAVDALSRARRVSYSGEQKYYYWHRPGSITTRKFNPERDFGPVEAYDYNYVRACEIDKDLLEDVARMRCCWARFLVLDKMIVAKREDLPQVREYLAYLKANRRFILRRPEFTGSRKIAFSVLCLSFGLYKVFVRLQAKREQSRLNA